MTDYKRKIQLQENAKTKQLNSKIVHSIRLYGKYSPKLHKKEIFSKHDFLSAFFAISTPCRISSYKWSFYNIYTSFVGRIPTQLISLNVM